MATATITVGTDVGAALSGAKVSLSVPSDVANFTPSATYTGGGSSTNSTGIVTFSLPYTTSSWTASVQYLGATIAISSGGAISSTANSSPSLNTQTRTVTVEAVDGTPSPVNNATFSVTTVPSGTDASWTGTLTTPSPSYTGGGSNTSAAGTATFVLPYGVGWVISGHKTTTNTATITVSSSSPSATTTIQVAP
jgi:hypothetical protein